MKRGIQSLGIQSYRTSGTVMCSTPLCRCHCRVQSPPEIRYDWIPRDSCTGGFWFGSCHVEGRWGMTRTKNNRYNCRLCLGSILLQYLVSVDGCRPCPKVVHLLVKPGPVTGKNGQTQRMYTPFGEFDSFPQKRPE